MEHSVIKDIKKLIKSIKALNKCLSKFNDADIKRLFGEKAKEIKEAKESMLYSEEVLENIQNYHLHQKQRI